MRDEPVWPYFFYDGDKPLVGKRRTYRKGDALEIQNREYAKSIGTYTVLNVRSRANAAEIATRGLDLKQAAKLVEA